MSSSWQGDPRAFGEFYARHERAVFRFFYRRVADAELAADLSAECFAAALLSAARAPALTTTRPPSRGCSGSPATSCGAAPSAGGSSRAPAPGSGCRRWCSRTRRSPRSERIHAGQLMENALAYLPADQAEAVRARIVDEREYDDIARELRTSEAVVRKRVSRGLGALRRRVEDRRMTDLPQLQTLLLIDATPAAPAPAGAPRHGARLALAAAPLRRVRAAGSGVHDARSRDHRAVTHPDRPVRPADHGHRRVRRLPQARDDARQGTRLAAGRPDARCIDDRKPAPARTSSTAAPGCASPPAAGTIRRCAASRARSSLGKALPVGHAGISRRAIPDGVASVRVTCPGARAFTLEANDALAVTFGVGSGRLEWPRSTACRARARPTGATRGELRAALRRRDALPTTSTASRAPARSSTPRG